MAKEKGGRSIGLRELVFAAIGIIILLSPIIAYFASQRLPFEFLNLVTIANVIVSLLLSLALIYVYTSMIEAQNRQTQIQKNQESLMELQNIAAPQVVSWDGDGDLIRITVTNMGSGTVTNISAGIRVQPQNIDYSEDFTLSKRSLYQEGEIGRKSFLMGKETATFVNQAIATTVVKNYQNWEFSRVINHLVEEGEKEIEFIVVVKFDDLENDASEVRLTSRVVEIEEGMTFEKALRNSHATNTVPRPQPTETFLQMAEPIDQSGLYFNPMSASKMSKEREMED